MVHTMARHDTGPIAVRYPRGNGVGVELPATPERLEIGKGRMVREGKTVAILSLGTRLAEALKAVSTSPVVYAEIPHAQHAFDFYYGSPRAHYTAQAVEEFLYWVQTERKVAPAEAAAG